MCLESGIIPQWKNYKLIIIVIISSIIKFIFILKSCRQKDIYSTIHFSTDLSTKFPKNYYLSPLLNLSQKSFSPLMPKLFYSSTCLSCKKKVSRREWGKKKLIIFKRFKGYCSWQIFSLVQPLEFLIMWGMNNL